MPGFLKLLLSMMSVCAYVTELQFFIIYQTIDSTSAKLTYEAPDIF